ncbi:MAG TPA: DUF3488 and transglutaminase-like domain-containing protein [Actinomycetes bacterium]|nr:DUF3488 and transglutaminase-like domain-containing protein [Actinomycetes bacterium]
MITRRDLLEQAGPSAAAAGAVILTSFALAPTLGDGPWFMSTLLVVAAVAVIGTLLRTLAWPGWAVTAAQGVALLLIITWMFAGPVARFGFIPDPDVWRAFGTLAERGSDVINNDVAPVPVTEGVKFLVVIGVAFIAWVVDAVAVTWRQATMAGIPLLTLYLVPAIVLPDGVPWPLFLVAGAGWLLLLLTDGRRELMRWGRPVDDHGSNRLHSVGGTGRRLGAAALTVAVIVPVVLPSLDDGRFGFGGGDEGSGDGDSSSGDPSEDRVTTLNPITDLKRNLKRGEDSLTFTYTTTTPNPDYFRVATLDAFDGYTWRLEELSAGSDQQVADGVPTPDGIADEVVMTTATYDITIESFYSKRLPVPYPVSSVDIDGDWRYDADSFDVFTPNEEVSTLGQSYTASQRAVAPSIEQLQNAGEPETPASTLTEIPDATSEVLGDLPFQVTEGARTPYEQALILQNWFRTEFDYSLDQVSGNDDSALRDFLQDRSGYCEQFAATMALMARDLGIPARVVVGYTPGEYTSDGVWQVTAHDAHAWPELWFEGVGWTRFEPTPGGGDGGATPVYAPTPEERSEPSGNGGGGVPPPVTLRRGGGTLDFGGPGRKSVLPREVLKANRNIGGLGATSDPSGASGDSSTGGSRVWLVLTLLAIAVVAALAPAMALRIRRMQRWRSAEASDQAVLAAWADVLDAAVDIEVAIDLTDTPRDIAARIPERCRLGAEAADDVRQLADWVERLRYSSASVTLPSVTDIRVSAERVRTQMYYALSPRDRRRVNWWPASGRRALADAWTSLSETAGEKVRNASSRAWSTVSGWFRRRPRAVAPTGPRSGS